MAFVAQRAAAETVLAVLERRTTYAASSASCAVAQRARGATSRDASCAGFRSAATSTPLPNATSATGALPQRRIGGRLFGDGGDGGGGGGGGGGNDASPAPQRQCRAYTPGSPAHYGGSRRRPPPNFGIVMVPQQHAFIVQRFGKFNRTLQPGLHLLIPVVDHVAYVHSLKEDAISIHSQMAITRDNVTISIDGVLYARVVDAVAASYGVEDPYTAITLLAQTTMRSELGKLSLDKTFEEREVLNARIVNSINEAATAWGMQCLRYEIRDISPPANVRKAMELQAEAERRKRAQVLNSEGDMQSEINVAEGQKRSTVLSSEAIQIEQVNHAQGEAEAILARSRATAKGLRVVADAILQHGGNDAVAMRVAEQYVSAFGNLAKEGNSIVVPASVSDARGMIAQALSIWEGVGGATRHSGGGKGDGNGGGGGGGGDGGDGGSGGSGDGSVPRVPAGADSAYDSIENGEAASRQRASQQTRRAPVGPRRQFDSADADAFRRALNYDGDSGGGRSDGSGADGASSGGGSGTGAGTRHH